MKLQNILIRGIGYNYYLKKEFHTAARRCLRKLAAELSLQKGEFEVRSNKGGDAVSGEVTLHCDFCYVQVSQIGKGSREVLYRTCEGRRDYTGGSNNFCTAQYLEDNPAGLARTLKKLRQHNGAPAGLIPSREG